MHGFVFDLGLDGLGIVSDERSLAVPLQLFDAALLDRAGETRPVDVIVGVLGAFSWEKRIVSSEESRLLRTMTHMLSRPR